MAQANAAGAGALPQVDGAVPLVRGAALPQMDVGDGAARLVHGAALPQMGGARVHGAVQAAAPAVALVAGPLFPQGGLVDVDGLLLGPLPTKSNGSCTILPKIAGESWP